MPAPDETIFEILNRSRTPLGDLDPLSATAELSMLYEHSWVDKHKCAAADIESYKKRHSFKASGAGQQMDFYSIVVLNEGKERIWAFRGDMTKPRILMRIALITKKDQEHHQAVEEEIAYWHDQMN